jgi:hypothetical protein
LPIQSVLHSDKNIAGGGSDMTDLIIRARYEHP